MVCVILSGIFKNTDTEGKVILNLLSLDSFRNLRLHSLYQNSTVIRDTVWTSFKYFENIMNIIGNGNFVLIKKKQQKKQQPWFINNGK